QGEKMAEGNPKEMVDLYKRLLVGQAGEHEEEISEKEEFREELSENERWRKTYPLNPEKLEYGGGEAKIVDFTILDDRGMPTNTITKSSSFTIKMKVKFFSQVTEPIFAYTFKNIQG